MATLNRREFLKASAMGTVAILAASCSQPTPQVIEKETPVEKAADTPVPVTTAQYKEAPMLAALVEQGKLPSVDERLPQEPLVLEPVETIGKYGGGWRFMSTGTSFGHVHMVNYVENFAKWERDTTGHRANLLRDWAWNADGTEITLHFRKGIKWSDGEPLTVDDWLFWWNDMVLDEKVNIGKQTGTFVQGEPMDVSRIDDYTIKLGFAASNPLFIPVMCRGTGGRATSWQVIPAHVYKNYHYKYNTALKDTDVDEIRDRYNNRTLYNDMPHFGPWVPKEVQQGEYCILERNPYYWKMDTEGNQLPYMDSLEIRLAQDTELIVLSCISGEIDFQMRQLEIKDISVLKDNATEGDYEVRMWKNGDCNSAGILFHYCYPDESIAELLWNQKFRWAMSYAINRERINDIVFLGLGKVRQIVMFEDGPEYQSERGQKVLKDWEDTYSEYDPERAKNLLDEIGVVDKDGDGWREKPDGSPLELIIDVNVNAKNEVEAQQLIKEDYEDIGLKWTLNVIDGTVLGQRVDSCESMFRSRGGAASGLFIAQSHWTPVEDTGYCIAGRPYGAYYQSGGERGIPAPPGSMLEKLQQVYTDAILIVDEKQRNERILDGYQIHIDEGPIQIGTVGSTVGPVVVKNDLKNVPDQGVIGSWVYGFPGTADPEQWFKA